PRNDIFFSDSSSSGGLFMGGDVEVSGHAWIEPDYITAQFLTTGIQTQPMKFTGLPNNVAISYAIDLSSLGSGAYPYNSHYEVHLKELIIGTRTIHKHFLFSSSTEQQSFSETRAIEQAYPSDLQDYLFVQNQMGSAAGRGWRLSGAQKIVNPSQDKI